MSQTDSPGLFETQVGKKKLSFNQKVWIGLAVLVSIPVLLFLSWWMLMLHLDSEQEIAGEVIISTEWVEFAPEIPLKPEKDAQEVVLDSAVPLVRDNLDLKNIRLTDGTQVKPELQLVDQYGNVFNATVNRYMTPSRYNNGISCSVPRLPEDRLYTKVRVRSDKPLKLARIVWHCYEWQ